MRSLYTVPAPERKDTFFQSSDYRAAARETLYSPRISWSVFLQTQMHYIRKWNWLLSLCIFAAAILLTLHPWQTTAPQEQLQELSAPVILSACIPFLALATIAEAGRSARFGMEELELSARFSLQAVLCARLGILGGGNLLLLAVLMPFGTYFWETGPEHDCSLYSAALSADLRPHPSRGPKTPRKRLYYSMRRGQRSCQHILSHRIRHRLSGPCGGYSCTYSRSTSLLRNCSSTGTQKIYQTIGGINMELYIDRLSKHYKSKIAVDRISLTLGKGVHGTAGCQWSRKNDSHAHGLWHPASGQRHSNFRKGRCIHGRIPEYPRISPSGILAIIPPLPPKTF